MMETFERIALEYRKDLPPVVLLSPGPADAEEAAQDVLLRVWKVCRRFVRVLLSTWIYAGNPPIRASRPEARSLKAFPWRNGACRQTERRALDEWLSRKSRAPQIC